MNSKLLIWAASLMLPIASYAQISTQITAHIKGLNSDSVYLLTHSFNANDTPKWDTLVSEENRFVISQPLDILTELFIIPKQMIFQFPSGRKYIPPTGFVDLVLFPGDSIIIKGSISKGYLDYTVEGSVLNNKAATVRSSYKALNQRAVALEVQMANLPEDSSKARKSKELFNQRVQTTSQISRIKKNYIQLHPDDALSAFFLLKQPLSDFGDLYPTLTNPIKKGPFSSALRNQYSEFLKFIQVTKNSDRLKIGMEAPDFILAASDENKFRLSSIKNKSDIIVLDFWGSWCGWCIKEFPKMKTYYKNHKDQLTIIGVACNDTKKNWNHAVKAQLLPWINVINNESEDNDVSVKYGVKAFPTKFILNKQLKIIGIYKGTDTAFFKTLDQLLNK